MFVRKLKIAALVLLACGIVATGGVLTHYALTAAPPEKEALPQPPKSAPNDEAAPRAALPKVPNELLEKRLEAVQAVYKGKLARIIRVANGLPVELLGWSERWLDAELALTDKKAARLAAVQAHVDRTREVERLLQLYARTGAGKHSDAAAGTYDRVNAEIRFFEITGKLPAPAPKAKSDPDSILPAPLQKAPRGSK